jgi:hypothetical protein
MKKGVYITLLFCLVAIIGAGCGDKPITDPEKITTNTKGNVNSSTNASGKPLESTEESEEIQVFFVDTQVSKLEHSKAEISYTDSSDKYRKVFEALQINNDPELISLWSKIELLSMKLNEGTLIVDVHIPDEARLGSGGELLALEALKETLFQFEEVKSIELLIDSEALESFMGHSELEHPILRDSE